MTEYFNLPGELGPDMTGPEYMQKVKGAVQRLSEGINAYLTDIGGTGNAITATCDAEFYDGLKAGMLFVFRAAAANTGAVTLKINDESAVDVVDLTGAALVSGRIAANSEQLCFFSGHHSKFVLVSDTRVTNRVLDYQAFTSSGTWTKPAGTPANALVIVRLWGAGGGGGTDSGTNGQGAGAGGGGYNEFVFRATDLASSVSITIGAGGTAGNAGGNTSFGSLLTAYGGGRGGNGSGSGGGGGGGGGGGATSAGSNGSNGSGSGGNGGAGGGPARGAGGAGAGGDSADGGGGGGGGASSAFGNPGGNGRFGGGGGGGGGGFGSFNGGNGGDSLYGGAGGAGDGNASAGSAGTSIHGGNGGAVGANGSAPGGGGGRNASGARGEARIWVIS